MGRIERQKRQLIEEANKRLLGEQMIKRSITPSKSTFVPDYSPEVQDATYVSPESLGVPEIQSQTPDYLDRVLWRDNVLRPLLDDSLQWWRDWLSNPKTISKWWLVRGITYPSRSQVTYREGIWKKYFNILNGEWKLRVTGIDIQRSKNKKNTIAWVNSNSPNTIYLNYDIMKNKTDVDNKSTLIHEIQHLLYHIEPLNPEGYIHNLGSSSLSKLIYNTIARATPFISNVPANDNLVKILSSGADAKSIDEEWSEELNLQRKEKPDYICEPTEQLSRVEGIRYFFNLEPGEDITEEDFVGWVENGPYGLPDPQIYWLILCWAEKGYKDLGTYLGDLNSLAAEEGTPPDKYDDIDQLT